MDRMLVISRAIMSRICGSDLAVLRGERERKEGSSENEQMFEINVTLKRGRRGCYILLRGVVFMRQLRGLEFGNCLLERMENQARLNRARVPQKVEFCVYNKGPPICKIHFTICKNGVKIAKII